MSLKQRPLENNKKEDNLKHIINNDYYNNNKTRLE